MPKKPVKKGPNIFDFLNQICFKTKKYEYSKKDVSAYMLSLWLSHEKDLISTVNDLNHFQFKLPDDLIYKYYYDRVPKGKRFIRWTKKETVDKKTKVKLDALKEKYNISTGKAKSLLLHLNMLK